MTDSYTQRAEALAQHIADDGSLHGVVGVPLFLLVACRAYIGGSPSGTPLLELPATRVQLLEHCIQVFDQDWEAQKKDRRFELLMGELERAHAYEQVAWEFARKGQFGSFPRLELKKALARTPDDAGELVKRNPEKALGDLPLLVTQSGHGASTSWGFMATVLQEHFAARHLAKQDDPFQVIQPVLHHPAWRNVICLTAGLIEGEARREAYIQQILETGSEWEETIHRDLFLAAECLGEASVSPDSATLTTVADHLIGIALWDSGWDFHQTAAEALGNLGPAAVARAVGPLLEAVRDEDPDVRESAAEALGKLGPAVAAQAVGPLLEAIRDKDPNVWEAAAAALGDSGPAAAAAQALGPLLEALRGEDSEVRVIAAEALGNSGPAAAAQAVGPLLEAVRDEDPDVREAAAEALGKLGPAAAQQAVGPLIEALRDEYSYVGKAAAKALGALGPAVSKQAVEPLIEALADKNSKVFQSAAEALGALGPAAAQQAVGPLIEALRHDSAGALARLLADPDPALRQVLQALTKALGGEERRVRHTAAEATEPIGPGDGGADRAPRFTRLPDSDSKVRQSAAKALGALGPAAAPQAVGPLLGAIRDDNWHVRQAAADALGWFGPAAAPQAMWLLVKALWDEDSLVQLSAANALAEFGLPAAQYPRCLKALARGAHDGVLNTLVALLEAEKPVRLPEYPGAWPGAVSVVLIPGPARERPDTLGLQASPPVLLGLLRLCSRD